MKNNKQELSKFWFIISNVIPPVGFFLYFRHRKTNPGMARRALISATIGVPVALAGGYIMNTFIFN